MSYTAWSVVFGEQPTAAKWNQLGANDAGFKDGTNIDTGAITAAKISGFDKSLLTTDSNPYKFSVHKSGDQTGIADNALTKVTWNTEKFDTNNNFDSTTNNRYVAPVAGFYLITSFIQMSSINSTEVASSAFLYKNGAAIQNAGGLYPAVGVGNGVTHFANIAHLVQLAASDYLEIFISVDVISSTINVTGGTAGSSFSGFLVART